MTQQIEKEIIARCLEGDKSCYRKIVKSYYQMIFSLALKLLGDEEDAKDVVQETFIKTWVNLSNWNSNYRFSTWLYSIASHLCYDRLRTKKDMRPLPEDEAFMRHYLMDSDSQRQLEISEWVSVVRVMADGLSDKQRLVFTLSQLEGLDSLEIEKITGMDASQIKSNLYIAKKTIRERLTKLGYVQD